MSDLNPSALDSTELVNRHASYQLFRIGLSATVALTLWLVWKSPLQDTGLKAMGVGIIFLAVWPALNWARLSRTWFPAFEIFMLTLVNFYAIPLLTAQSDIGLFSSEVMWQSALIVLIYGITANLAFNRGAASRSRTPKWRDSLLPERLYSYIPLGVGLSTVHLYLVGFTELVPYELHSILRAVFFGVGTISTFVLTRLHGAGVLSRQTLAFLVINLVMQVIMMISQLYLITGISLIVLALIGYVSSSRKIPWIPIIVVLPILMILHNGKSDMRLKYWENEAPNPTLAELPQFFEEWVGYGLHPGETKEDESITTGLLKRASLFQMLCLSVSRVPDEQPYLWGESYVDVPALFIPRILWPDKPSALLSNIRLALYFDLVDEESAFKVSIAFGMLSEAYINFGMIGAIGLGFVFGAGYKRLASMADGAPYFSAIGLLMIVLTAWSFQAEQAFATWISSLFQACVVVIGIPLAYRKFMGSN